MHDFIKITKALSDPTRVRILGLLLGGELCVCNIVTVLGLAQPTISKHLKQCTDAGLTVARKSGGWTHYRLATESTAPFVADFLPVLEHAVQTDPEFVSLQSTLTALKKAKNIL
ncbi:MAG: metalloregulator ArsR/SmtB family transcription factor [Desulfovibrionales bacterium]|nr:metalloregulator ArsR/SmtB family transcription factor [Desulfovibrionales bacterium]